MQLVPPAFPWVLQIQSQILMPVQQVLHLLVHHPRLLNINNNYPYFSSKNEWILSFIYGQRQLINLKLKLSCNKSKWVGCRNSRDWRKKATNRTYFRTEVVWMKSYIEFTDPESPKVLVQRLYAWKWSLTWTRLYSWDIQLHTVYLGNGNNEILSHRTTAKTLSTNIVIQQVQRASTMC